eukprot:CAMPEP_0184487690 /NCGR_PEP_ID=MMETSP0113_2-20130426/10267_1 /TAXON_ID=91329 /ORGANISM="Norrisiella sphaerica, Strain BC52" /LENGTH=261 /DNA_ID=CAMNT_0026870069 /DNA_START=186 /DNA_END=969 /DNA_ORIENTATION=+
MATIFVDYKHLKELLKELFPSDQKDEEKGTVYGTYGSAENKGIEFNRQQFINELIKEVEKVNAHYKKQEEKLHQEYKTVSSQALAVTVDRESQNQGLMRSINISFVDMYRNLNMLNNFVYLNKIAFDKIAKKFDKASHGKYRKVFEKKINQTYFATSTKIADLLRDTAAFYANLFENGDVTKAKVRLLAKMAQGSYGKNDMLWLGFKIGIVLMLVFWNLFNLVVSPNLHIKEGMEVFIPLYRAVGLIVSLIWMWGFNIYIW